MQEIHELHTSWDKKKNEKLVNKILVIVIIILFIIIFAEVMFQFIILPQLKISKIVIKSDLGLSEEEVLHIAGISKNVYYFSLNKAEVELKLKSYPVVRDATVVKEFPNTLKLDVVKRNPLVITLIEDKGLSLPALIDEQGVVFYIGRLIDDYNFPVISGLDFNGYGAGMKLPEVLLSFLDQLYLLKKSARTLYDFISEIKVLPIGNKDFELLFYMIPYTTKIRFGNSINENILTYAMMVLDVLKHQGMADEVKEIDFRSKEIVYKREERGDA
ncbi:MAG: FtsQ-type POTRA domain-containing protein [Spirochaetales bacterium]|nr:FtsQ-type POTRA domain-containing protein [Spirochaetales bacterium]